MTNERDPTLRRGSQSCQGGQDGGHDNSDNSSQTNQDDSAWDCKDCAKSFVSNSDKICVCDLCSSKHCIQCVNMSTKEYKALQVLQRSDVFWLCKDCTDEVRLSKKQTKLCTDLANLKLDIQGKFDQLEQKVNSITDQMTKILILTKLRT